MISALLLLFGHFKSSCKVETSVDRLDLQFIKNPRLFETFLRVFIVKLQQNTT